MKKACILMSLGILLVAACACPVTASKATPEEALSMAGDWVSMIVSNDGEWAGSITPEVTEARKLAKAGRMLGYFCPVNPRGYVVVSYYKELASVKAWSDSGDLDISQDRGMAAFIKDGLERMIIAVENKTGKKIDQVSDEEIARVVEINYLRNWSKPVGRKGTENSVVGDSTLSSYSEGRVLLTSSWHQGWPYNQDCSILGCTDPRLNGRAWVGCVATAGAQIMKYWSWPLDSYNWTLIPDKLTTSSPADQISETARLCHEVGLMALMDYGCDGSSTPTEYMVTVFGALHYSDVGADTTVHKELRVSWPGQQWWELIGMQHDVNRPVQYRVAGHSIVCDGHRVDGGVQQFHMNYGWDNSYTTWYALDALYKGDPPNEYIVTDIVPHGAIEGAMSGIYPGTFGSTTRYFDRDATGTSAIFSQGMRLQFLPNITAKCTSTTGGFISFIGTPAEPTRMFTRGDVSRGVIVKGEVRLKENGMVAFR